MAIVNTSAPIARRSLAHLLFRIISFLAALSVLALVVLGGVVRVTGSGLGCPDWPLCHGGILPPLEPAAIIEFSHRVLASFLAGPLVLATCVMAWLMYRRVLSITLPASLALVLVLTQALLGGATVESELSGGLVSAHFALGQALLGCLVIIVVVTFWRSSVQDWGDHSQPPADRFPFLAMMSAVGVYALLVSGSYVTTSGATGACLGWPLCQGDVFPEERLQVIHMSHRWATAIIGLVVLYILHLGFRNRTRPLSLRAIAMSAATLLLIQVMLGAATVWLKFPPEFRAVHQSMATVLWAAMVAVAALSFLGKSATPAEHYHA